ncbi:TetR/AcrR family transcriptional regulator [Nocardia sp. NPDC050630]|uniref:TetR/AcrR family transcriptional regulator n=1 Tax=Nocardia sp. NPDC050630 TaxID=3364321 RepID=UPI0037B21AC0
MRSHERYSWKDLTVSARIREAAIELFADRGVEATSLRDIADRAGISIGAVQHHFGTKDRLHAAIGDHVLSLMEAEYGRLLLTNDPIDAQRELAEAATTFVRDHSDVMRFIARGVADTDQQAIRIFNWMVDSAHRAWANLVDSELTAPDVDAEWMALQIVLALLGTALMGKAVEERLGAPLTDPIQLQRWHRARTILFARAIR